MPCYHPLAAYQAKEPPEGKTARAIRFNFKRGYTPIDLPCGKCIGCRLDRSRMWATRCVHHAQLSPDNCFLTLTYDDQHLPHGATLYKHHLQKFLRRLRKLVYPKKIEFFGCGEYGDEFGRPHYHALIFNHTFEKESVWKKSHAGFAQFLSSALTRLWPYGRATLGELTFESAAYCARYALKKINGPLAKKHYTSIDPATGEITHRAPEFILMSLKRPIGKAWLTVFKSDVYPHDFVVLRGGKFAKPPRYYDQQLSEAEIAPIKEARALKAKANPDNTAARLAAREAVKLAQTKQLKRGLQ